LKIITLLTDFGNRDPYAGIMKGVILSIKPDVRIVDITHEIDPQDVREGAFVLEEYYHYFEKGTIHVAVVDPTVGSARKAIVFHQGGYSFVGPDNGLFSLVLDGAHEVNAIENKRYMQKQPSATFHGRDIFAPAAAFLASGVSPCLFGSPVTDPVRLPGLYPDARDNCLQGEIIRFDRFGNGISNISGMRFSKFTGGRPFKIQLAAMTFTGLNQSYFESELTCLVGSSGYLEFGLFKGNLFREMGLSKGDLVSVTLVGL